MNAPSRQIAISDTHFDRIVEIAAVEAGLAIPLSKKSLVQSRVTRRMCALGLQDCGTYLDSLGTDQEERKRLISVLTTNVSHFFRERHHFDFLRDRLLSGNVPRRLRFWSAGCSNGQEPYSLAIEILKAIPDAESRDILILATDIDEQVIERAIAGVYAEREMSGVPAPDRETFFEHEGEAGFRVRPALRNMVRFRTLNLNGPNWPMRGPFDAILCRNVVIYFNSETQRALWPRFRQLLIPDGMLLLGHSERIHPLEGSGFETVGVTTYRKL